MENTNVKLSLPLSRKMRRVGLKCQKIANAGLKQQNIVVAAVLIVLILVFFAINTNFLSKSNLLTMSNSLLPYAIMALGVTFVIATGGIDLSVGTVMYAAGYTAGYFYTDKGMPLWMVIPVAILIGGLFGLLNGVLIAKLKLPPFIATLGTMLLSRGLPAVIIHKSLVSYTIASGGKWFDQTFKSINGFPIGLVWMVGFMLLCMYLMYKNKVGRYILSIGSNEEATRLSGVNTDKYKILAYVFCGIGAGIASIFWAASQGNFQVAQGNGMELDTIAGVYIGGTSASGGIASVGGSIIGSILIVVLRNGVNIVFGKLGIDINGTHFTYIVTGVVVVGAVVLDVFKQKQAGRVKIENAFQLAKKAFTEKVTELELAYDNVLIDATLQAEVRSEKAMEIRNEINDLKVKWAEESVVLKAEQKEKDRLDRAEKKEIARRRKEELSAQNQNTSGQDNNNEK